MTVNWVFVLPLVIVSLLVGPAMAQRELSANSFTALPSQDGRCRGDTGRGDKDRSEEACLQQLTGVVTRQGDSLRVTFQDGSSRVYADRSAGCDQGESDDCVDYKISGYFPKHGLLLLMIGYYEGVEWMLVRLDRGKETKVRVPPHYSPRENWLVSVCWSEGPAGCGNGVDIVPTLGGQASSEWHYEVPDKEYALYEFVAWEGEDRVKLNVTFRDGGGNFKTLPASVDRIAGRWRLKLPKEYRKAVRR
jgi:hypothetical protein